MSDKGVRSKEYGVRNEKCEIITEEFSIKYLKKYLQNFWKNILKISKNISKIFKKYLDNLRKNVLKIFEQIFEKYF